MKKKLFFWCFLLATSISPKAMEKKLSDNSVNFSGNIQSITPLLLQNPTKELQLEQTIQEIEKIINKKDQSKKYYELAEHYRILPSSSASQHDDQENKCWLFYEKALQADPTHVGTLKIVKKYPEKFGFTNQTVYNFLFDSIHGIETILTILEDDYLTLESQFIRFYYALENKLRFGSCSKIKGASQLEDIRHIYNKNPILSLPLITAAYNSPESIWDYPHVLDEMIHPFKHLYFLQEFKNDDELYEQTRFLYAFAQSPNLSFHIVSPILYKALYGTLEKVFFVLLSRGYPAAIEDYSSLLSIQSSTCYRLGNQECLNLLEKKREALKNISILLSTSHSDGDNSQFIRNYNLELLKLLPTEYDSAGHRNSKDKKFINQI